MKVTVLVTSFHVIWQNDIKRGERKSIKIAVRILAVAREHLLHNHTHRSVEFSVSSKLPRSPARIGAAPSVSE